MPTACWALVLTEELMIRPAVEDDVNAFETLRGVPIASRTGVAGVQEWKTGC